jgi:cell division septation protein DedD
MTKLLCGILIVFTAAGLVSSKIISTKITKRLAEKKIEASKKEPPLFFYNSIGATPAFSTPKEIKFDSTPKFTVEVGYTKTRSGAERVIDKLNLSGFPVFMTPIQLKTGKVVYKIRMGLFSDKENAANAKYVLRERTKYKGRLVALN